MTTMTKNEVLAFEKFEAEIRFREVEKRRTYVNHAFQVVFKVLTPKGKYMPYKIEANYVYADYEQALKAAEKWIEIKRINSERHKQRIEETRKKNADVVASDFFKVGDFVVNTWGYEQTNVNFYQVTEVKNKTIRVAEVYQETVEGSVYSHGMACEVIPKANDFIPDGAEYLLRVKSEGRLSHPKSFYYMKKWHGSPEYKSWYY